jgi:hypothetical protein
VNFSHIPKFEILGCDKPTALKMNLLVKIRTDRERNFGNSVFNTSSLFFVILNEPRNVGASLPRTLKHHKTHIGDTLRHT